MNPLSLQELPLPRGSAEQLRNDAHFRNRMALLGDAQLKLDATRALMLSNPKMSAGELTKLRVHIECRATHAAFMRDGAVGAKEFCGGANFDSASEHTLSQWLEALIGILSEVGRDRVLVTALFNFAIQSMSKRRAKKKQIKQSSSQSAKIESIPQPIRDNRHPFDRLADACERGDLAVVRRELQFTDVNALVRADSTPLILACVNQRVDVARLLLQRGANALKSSRENSAIHCAAKIDRVDLIDLLVVHGADVNARNGGQTTPLHLASQHNHHGAVRRLLAAGARVAERDELQQTALHVAARAGHCDVVRPLVDAGASIAARTVVGETPLMCAAESGSLDCVAELIARGASVADACYRGRTALFVAASNGREAVVQHLLSAGSQVDARNNIGFTPLTAAINARHIGVVRLLLFAGADVRNHKNRVCINMAMRSGATDVIPTLIAAGADVDASEDGRSALMHAAATNRTNVVAVLLAGGADGRNALMGTLIGGYAIQHARSSIAGARMALAAGRRVSSKCVVCRAPTQVRCIDCGSLCCSMACEQNTSAPHKQWCKPTASWLGRVFHFIKSCASAIDN